MVDKQEKQGFISMLYDLLEMAADLYADGDKSRVKLQSDPDGGNLEVFVDGISVDRFDDEPKVV